MGIESTGHGRRPPRHHRGATGLPPSSRRSNASAGILEFIAAPAIGRATAMHVLGPDDDQPGYESIADYLATRRFRAVCGRIIRLRPPDGTAGVFDDHLLCADCRAAFGVETGRLC
jgi:hypothetical protein